MRSRYGWRHQDDDKADAECRENTGIRCEEESLTQQHFAKDCDVNVIAKRYGLDQSKMPVAPLDPRAYGDFTNVPDLRTALEQVRTAEEHFNALPPRLRARFDNRPFKLWDFVNDPDNWEEAERLGLLQRPPDPPTVTNVTDTKTPT